MKVLSYALYMSVFLLWSCSDDDDINQDATITTDFPNFSFLNFSQPGAILQYQYFADTQTGDFIDIASLDAINPGIQRVHIAGDIAGMYAGSQVWLKDLRGGSVLSAMNFFPESDTEFRNWTINSESIVFSGYHDSINFDNFIIRVINLNNNVISNISVGNIGQTVEAVVYQNYLVFYENTDIQTKLVVINVDTMESLGIQLFENLNITGTVFGEQNDIFVFFNNETYIRFDLSSFSPLDSGPSSLQIQLNGSEIVDDSKIYFVSIFPEPTTLEPLPAIYDIVSQETILIDIAPVFIRLAEENGWNNLVRTTINYSPSSESWIIGYRYTDVNGIVKGGIAKFSNNAVLLANLEVSDFPWNLVVLE